MLKSELTELLYRLDSGRSPEANFVESPELLAYRASANRVARLRLVEPLLGDRLLRLDRAGWHCHVAFILATWQDDPETVAARLLGAGSSEALLADAVGMSAVSNVCLGILKHAPHQALPLDCYRLLARSTEDAAIAKAYRSALANATERLDVPAFVRLLQEITISCGEERLAADLHRMPAEYRIGLAKVIRTLRHLGLLLPEKEERRCLGRLRNLEDFTSWAARRLKSAVAPSSFGWLKVPSPGFHPIESAALLSEKARSMRNCAAGMRYLLDLATGLSCFATVRPLDHGSEQEEHLVQLRVSGRYVLVLEIKRANNQDALLSAKLLLEQVFRQNAMECVGSPAEQDLDWMLHGL